MNTDITTIIVNYNAGILLQRCVESLHASNPGMPVVVVDNDSRDDSLASLAQYRNVTIIRNHANLGFATACNIGARTALTEYVLFLNPDSFVASDTLALLHQALQDHPKAGMAGGFLANEDGSEQPGGRRAIPTPWRSFVRGFGLTRFSKRYPRLFYDFHLHEQALPTGITEVEAISGACMMVRRSAMQDVGEWDEEYFLHCEDLDLCMRFRAKGWSILFVPDAVVKHDQGACGRSRPLFVEWHKHKGMIRFYRKFFSTKYPAILMLLVTAGVWLRFALVAVRSKLRQPKPMAGEKN